MEHVVYKGVSKVPGVFKSSSAPDRNQSFGAGGNVLAYNPDGPPGVGSLFAGGRVANILGQDMGEIWVAELSIPTPVMPASFTDPAHKDPSLLNASSLLRTPNFANPLAGISDQDNPDQQLNLRGMLVIDTPNDGRKLFTSRSDWYNVNGDNFRVMGCSNIDFTSPQGLWHVGDPAAVPSKTFHHNRCAGPIARFSDAFVAAHAILGGRKYFTGGFVQQGTANSSFGVPFFCFNPWDSNGDLYPTGGHFGALVAKVHEPFSADGPSRPTVEVSFRVNDWYAGFVFAEWNGRHAIIVAVKKSLGGCRKAIHGDASVDVTKTCNASNTPYGKPQTDLVPIYGDQITCTSGDGGKGYHCGPYTWMLYFFDPVEAIVEVLEGTRAAWDVQPYLRVNLGPQGEPQSYPDDYDDPAHPSYVPKVDLANYSWGRKVINPDGTIEFREFACMGISGMAMDPATGRIWILEANGDKTNRFEGAPVIHHFQLEVSS